MPIDIDNVNKELTELLPHRYPMLLVDRVLAVDPGQSILAQKNTTYNEPFYNGHFPDYPIMPGVLILEAAAQAAGLMMKINMENNANDLFVFAGADQVRFKKQISPGDILFISVQKTQYRGAFLKAEAEVYLDQAQTKLAFSATITLAWTKK